MQLKLPTGKNMSVKAVVLMGCFNPIEIMGYENFVRADLD